MRKRGQAAAFIIIGLVIIILVVGFLAIKKDFLSDLFGKISGEREAVPEQVKPIQTFLDSCVNQITKEGINIVAIQGGYLNLPRDPLPPTPFTPLSSSLEIIPNSDLKTSVWFREKSNGIQEINVPSKQDIENSIENYVENNFAQCVNNLTVFQAQGLTAEANAVPTASVQISNKKVSSVVEFPININFLSTNFTMKNHRADVDSSIGRLYEMAKQIIESENDGYFLENKTIDMLVAYDDQVPFSGTDLSCSEKVWIKTEVQENLKNIIFENVAAMKIKGTDYELQDKKFSYLEFDALEKNEKDITINMMYLPEWPTVIEITPSEGNILRSDLITKKAGGPVSAIASTFFCLNHHRFVYDIKYPVLITLTDSDGLIFQYATEVIIDNNQPRQNRLEILDLPDTNSQICQYPQKDIAVYTGTIKADGQLIPLDDVSLSFKCFPATCPIGTSSFENDETLLNAKVPLCVNGVLEGSKENYWQTEKTFYSSNGNLDSSLLVTLEPIYKKEVKVFVIDKDTGNIREPYSTEQINFQFAHKSTTYQRSYIYPDGENEIELISGDYLINSYILRNSSTYKITIPGQTIKSCTDTNKFGLLGFFKKKEVCTSTETDQMEFDTILTGGAVNINYEFDRTKLASDNPLNLYVLSSDVPSNLEDLQKIQIQVDTNKDHPLFKEPEIR